MRGCGGAEARPGSEWGRRRAAWRRGGGGLRPEERSRPPPHAAPARAQAALGPGGRPWECAAAGGAEGRGSGQPPAPSLAGGGGACGGPPRGGPWKDPRAGRAAPRAAGVTAIPLPPPRRSCSIGVLRLFAGVEEGGLVPGCCSGRGRGPRRVLGARSPSAPFLRTSAHSPRKLEPWRCPATPQPSFMHY